MHNRRDSSHRRPVQSHLNESVIEGEAKRDNDLPRDDPFGCWGNSFFGVNRERVRFLRSGKIGAESERQSKGQKKRAVDCKWTRYVASRDGMIKKQSRGH